MEAAFVNEKGNRVKCQCIVYCQKGTAKSITNSDFTEQLMDKIFTLDTCYYLFLFILLSIFIFGHKVCNSIPMSGDEILLSPERKEAIAEGTDSLTYIE